MRYKIGLKLWSRNTDNYYHEAIRLYNEGVFDYIELYIVPNTLETLEKWAKLNIPYVLHNAHFVQGFDLSNKDKRDFNKNIYEQTKQFADALNVDKIVFHGGIGGDINETVTQLEALNEPRALIENKPLVVAGEKYAGMHCIGATVDEIKFIIDNTGCGFCLDFGHAVCAANALNIEHETFIKPFLALKPDMYHLTDLNDVTSPYDSHAHLGKGGLDVLKYLSNIDDGKYVTFETEKSNRDNLNDFEQEIKWLKGV